MSTRNLFHQYSDVGKLREGSFYGLGNVGWRQSGSRHLIEQRLKEIMIATINDDHLRITFTKPAGAG